MFVRRNRRSTLTLLLLIALCVGGFAVCYSAEGEGDPFPADTAAAVVPSADRPSPYYEDEQVAAPETEARVEQSPLSRVKIFSKPTKTVPRPTTEDVPVVDDAPTAAVKTAAPGKTPLPKPANPEASDTGEAVTSPLDRSRINYGSGVIWAMGILAAGVILRQVLKAGGPLSNSAPTAVEVLSRQTLGPQQQLAVIRFGTRVLLVGTTSSGMTTLAQVEDPAEVQDLLAELQSSSASTGSNPLGFLRSKRSSAYSRADRSRWADVDHTSPAVKVSLSTEGRAAAHERRAPSPPQHEVNDV